MSALRSPAAANQRPRLLLRLWFATQVFLETAEGLRDALLSLAPQLEVEVAIEVVREVNQPTSYDGSEAAAVVTVLIGASYLSPWALQEGSARDRRWVVYQMEQLNSPHFSYAYREVMRAASQLWDFSPMHVRLWNSGAESALPKARFVPLPVPHRVIGAAVAAVEEGDGEQEDEEAEAEEEEDIDVLFYGACNERRLHVQRCFAAFAPHLNAQFVMSYDLFGEQRDELIRRSKVLLNVHFYPLAALEVHRIDLLLAKGKCVVSERSSDAELDAAYDDAVAFVDTMREPQQALLIVQKTLELLANRSERLQLRRAGQRFIREKQQQLAAPLKEAIDELVRCSVAETQPPRC